jgi:hypothetical protein
MVTDKNVNDAPVAARVSRGNEGWVLNSQEVAVSVLAELGVICFTALCVRYIASNGGMVDEG